MDNKIIINEYEMLKAEKGNLLERIDALSKSEAELQDKYNSSVSKLGEIDEMLRIILETIRSLAIKFEVSDNINKVFENAFVENMNIILNFITTSDKVDPRAGLINIENWVKINSYQLEAFRNKILERDEKFKEQQKLIMRMEKSLDELHISEDEKISNEKNFVLKIKNLEEEIKALANEKQSLEMDYEFLLKQLNEFKAQSFENVEQSKEAGQLLSEVKFSNEKLLKEKAKLEQSLAAGTYQEQVLEDKYKITFTEKKFYEKILKKIIEIYPIRTIARIINDMLNICETIALLERDKVQILQKLNKFDEDESRLKDNFTDQDWNTQRSRKFSYDKKEDLRMLNEYNKKIGKHLSFFYINGSGIMI